MAKLVAQGKVRFLGLSEAAPDRIALPTRCIRSPRCRRNTRCVPGGSGGNPEDHDELGISFVAYSPLGRGFLTGAIKSSLTSTAVAPRIRGSRSRISTKTERWWQRLRRSGREVLHAVAGDSGLAVGAGTGRGRHSRHPPRRRLDENVGALAVRLSTQDVARIAAAVPAGAAAGTRYPAGGMAGVFI